MKSKDYLKNIGVKNIILGISNKEGVIELSDILDKYANELKLYTSNNQSELLNNFLHWYNEDEEKTPITEDEIHLFMKENKDYIP